MNMANLRIFSVIYRVVGKPGTNHADVIASSKADARSKFAMSRTDYAHIIEVTLIGQLMSVRDMKQLLDDAPDDALMLTTGPESTLVPSAFHEHETVVFNTESGTFRLGLPAMYRKPGDELVTAMVDWAQRYRN